ncbi:MAG: outer membrane protein assembly factor [bacterium]
MKLSTRKISLLFAVIFFTFTQLKLPGQNHPELKAKLQQLKIHGNEKISRSEIQHWFNFRKAELISEKEVIQRCSNVLEQFKQRGYYFAKFDSLLFHYQKDSLQVEVMVYLQEGDLLKINTLAVNGVSAEDSEILAELQSKPGKIFRQEILQDDIDAIIQYYERKGYPFCKVTIVDFKLNKENPGHESRVDMTLEVTPGPQVRIGAIEIQGNEQTKDFVILRQLNIQEGENYNQLKVDKIRPQLMKLGYFKWVNPPKLEWQNDGTGKLIIELAEGNNNRFDGVIGYNPATVNSKGFVTGLIDISFRNLIGTGRQVEVHWERRTEKTQQLRFRYLEPWVVGLPLNAGFSFEQLIQDTSYVQRELGLDLRLVFNNNLSFFTQISKTSISPDSLGAVLFGIPPSKALNLAVGLTFNTLDHWLNPRRGVRYETSFAWSRKTLKDIPKALDESKQSNTFNQKRLAIDFETYFPLFRWQVFAIGLHGRRITSDEGEIPITEQYRFGGTRDLRGYREEQFRGSRIAWANVEYRYLLSRNSRIFVFLDSGYYFREDAEAAKIGYGVGLRLDTKLGFFGIDYGLGEGDGLSNGKIHLRLTNEF